MEKLGENVRNRRKQLGLTQDQVADLTGYTSRSSVAKIEKDLIDQEKLFSKTFPKPIALYTINGIIKT